METIIQPEILLLQEPARNAWRSHAPRLDQDFNFAGNDISFLDLKHMDLQGVVFSHSQCVGVCFDGADLSCADLNNCDVSNASFRLANLQGANLAEIKYENTNFEGAIFDGLTCLPFTALEALYRGMIFSNSFFESQIHRLKQ